MEMLRATGALAQQPIVGDYLVGRTLGEGSFAKVKIGTHLLTGTKVALKIINKKSITDPYVAKNLHREAAIMGRLNHKHIVRLYEVIETEQLYVLVQEYCPGGQVLDYIVVRNRLSEKDARRFMRQLVSALDHMHRHGVSHRDMKPENMLLDKDKNIKLIDFGLSNSFDSPQEQLHTRCGSFEYSAPELIGAKPYSGAAVDVFTLGVNMYAMLTGELPFQSDNISVVYALQLKEQYIIPPYISHDARSLIRRLLTPDPQRRATMEEVRMHPWMNVGYDGSVPPWRDDAMADVVREDVVDYVSGTLHLDPTAVMESVERRRFDRYYACYQFCIAAMEENANAPSQATGPSETVRKGLMAVALAANAGNPTAVQETQGMRRANTVAVDEAMFTGRAAAHAATPAAHTAPPMPPDNAAIPGAPAAVAVQPAHAEAPKMTRCVTVAMDQGDAGIGAAGRAPSAPSDPGVVTFNADEEPVCSIIDEFALSDFNDSLQAGTVAHAATGADAARGPYVMPPSPPASNAPSLATAVPGPRPSPPAQPQQLLQPVAPAKGKEPHQETAAVAFTNASPAVPAAAGADALADARRPSYFERFLSKFRHNQHPPAPTQMKVSESRFPMVSSMVSAQAPASVAAELRRVLDLHGVHYQQPDAMRWRYVCELSGVHFEAEVCKVAGLIMHGIRLKRMGGDARLYKGVMTKLVQSVHFAS